MVAVSDLSSFGCWRGEALDAVESARPHRVAHGSRCGPARRGIDRRAVPAGAWLDGQYCRPGWQAGRGDASGGDPRGRSHCPDALPKSFWRIDIESVSCTTVHGRGRVWTLRSRSW